MPLRLNNLNVTVNFSLAQSVDETEIAAFVADALESWGGQRRPDDPLFHSLSVNHVRIGDRKYVNEEPKRFDNHKVRA